MIKPKTKKDYALFRFKTSCEAGKKAIDDPRTAPPSTTPIEWALYNLFCALEEIPNLIENENENEK